MIDFKQFAKHSKPGPRYTSYPTAPEFHEGFTLEAYKRHIAASNTSGRALSLYFHIPFCRSACYFCGCNVVYTSREENKERYLDYLEQEMALLAAEIDTRRFVAQIHFGGGTPTFLSAAQLKRLITAIHKYFPNSSQETEFGCEIDPRFFTAEQMAVMQKGGVNRISFGVQDFDPQVQEAVHRIQSRELTAQAVQIARDHGVGSINIDLIYGLPFQSAERFAYTLKETLALDPDRIALFNYAHVPWLKKTMRKIDETTLPTPEEKLLIMQNAIETFEGAGMVMIGMDHFAKPTDELALALKNGTLHRNFQGYTTLRGTDLFGLGLTSIGEGADFYAQNFRDMGPYEAAIDAGHLPLMRGFSLDQEDRLRKQVIMQLMSNFTLDMAAFDREYNLTFEEHFADALKALEPYEQEGLVEIRDRKILISDTGRLLVSNLVMGFDAYLQKAPEERRRFSKTI